MTLRRRIEEGRKKGEGQRKGFFSSDCEDGWRYTSFDWFDSFDWGARGGWGLTKCQFLLPVAEGAVKLRFSSALASLKLRSRSDEKASEKRPFSAGGAELY